jgi:hypothetical protein
VVETIYPTLLKQAKSVRDAKNIVKNFVVAMDAAFQIDVRNYSTFRSGDRLMTLDMKSMLNPGQEQTAEFSWLEALKDEKISVVKGLLSGLSGELQRLTDRDEKDKPLRELKTEFL